MRVLSSNVRTEASGDVNQPLELYDVYLDSTTLRLAAYDQNVSFFDPDSGQAQTYLKFPVQREPKRSASDMSVDHVSVRVSNVDRAMSSYLAANDFRGKRVVIRKVFANYLSSSGDAAVMIDGLIDQVAVDQSWLRFEVKNKVLGTLRNEGPKRWYQLLCNWKFAGEGCANAEKASGDLLLAVTGTVESGSSVTRVIDAGRTEGLGITGNGYWYLGEYQILSGPEKGVRRIVIGSRSGSFDLDLSTSGDNIGQSYQIRRGCDKTLFVCSGDHANQLNFSGFPTIPQGEVIR